MEKTKVKQKISLEDIKRVEDHFIEVCRRDNIKWNTKKFYDYQSTYFCGAMTAWNCALVKWKIPMMTERPILTQEYFNDFQSNKSGE